MCFIRACFCGILLLTLVGKACLLENGVARTPPMGWMSWGYYMCANDCENEPEKCLNEELIMNVADKFYLEGYQEAGYEYIIIDDCWSKPRRVNGALVPDRKRFPRGMKFLADYIHSRGLKFGMYTNIAKVTCMGFPGSRDHFQADMAMFARWDVDYLKVDGCYVDETFLDTAYIDLGRHINNTGRPMVYACSWPYYKVFISNGVADYAKIASTCNVYRNYHDVFLNWLSVSGIIKYFEQEYPVLHKYHGPGQWNDPDMLIFGTNSLTIGQSRIQLAVYAMLSAPLLLSCNMSKITDKEQDLLLNLELIAIAQDPLGIMAKPYTVTILLF